MLNHKNILVCLGVIILIGCSVEEPKGSRHYDDSSQNPLATKSFDDAEFDCQPKGDQQVSHQLLFQKQTTYLTGIKQLVDKHCISCHNPNGNSPDLTSYSKLKAHAESSRAEIGAGTMPLTGPLESANMELFEKWVDQGFLEGESIDTSGDNGNSADAMVNKCL